MLRVCTKDRVGVEGTEEAGRSNLTGADVSAGPQGRRSGWIKRVEDSRGKKEAPGEWMNERHHPRPTAASGTLTQLRWLHTLPLVCDETLSFMMK